MNNKKVFINELETETRNNYIKQNKKLIEKLQNELHEDNMFQQGEVAICMLGKNYHDWIQYHDDYSSFYFTLKDYRKFLTNLDADYLSVEARKIYDEVISKLNTLDALDVYSDNWYNLENWIEEKSKSILKDAENYLHEFEEYPNEDDAIQYADEMEQLEEYYIEFREDDTTDGVIRRDVAFTECYI